MKILLLLYESLISRNENKGFIAKLWKTPVGWLQQIIFLTITDLPADVTTK